MNAWKINIVTFKVIYQLQKSSILFDSTEECDSIMTLKYVECRCVIESLIQRETINKLLCCDVRRRQETND